ncbi:MAG: type II toxin-antitoxin system RelE/ParE family toxin [Candidatus Riflebacteria bacterium]|nr:type II toxin-antitoxin system RelE/ParE family toxin [Candidatus Riflebacteria bacterium]
MEFEIEDKALIELFTTGRSSKKSFPPGIARKFVERIRTIEAASSIDDLRVPPSMQFERLQGFQNLFSIRLNQQFRLIFRLEFDDDTKRTGKAFVTDIWDHSKKY